MTTCKICSNIYSESRGHCPACGGFSDLTSTVDYSTGVRLVRASGALSLESEWHTEKLYRSAQKALDRIG